MPIAIALHILSAVIWVGGMFFAYIVLRPVAATLLEPPVRLNQWVQVFQRFFPFVWIAIVALPVSGYWMIFHLFESLAPAPLYMHIMSGIGTVMILIFLHVYFAPFRRLKRAVAAQDWPTGAKALAQIRVLIGVNLSLGILTVLIVSSGRYL